MSSPERVSRLSRRERRFEVEFTEFYLARGAPLRRTAYLVLRDWHAAEDATQQAFIKLYAAWPRIQPETRDAYARRAVVNTCLSLLRKARPETSTAQTPKDSAEVIDGDAPLDVGAALALLPPRQRAIVALRYLDDLGCTCDYRAGGSASPRS